MSKSHSKYEWQLEAVKNMQPGTVIEFRVNMPWALASYLYRHGKPEDVYLTILKHDKKVIAKREGEVMVWQEEDWKGDVDEEYAKEGWNKP
jgi:hypothetical protein